MSAKKVYKYYRFDPQDYWTHPLNLGEIYFGTFDSFNDPYECVFTFNTSGEFQEKKRQIREWNQSEDYKAEVDKCQNDVELARFTEAMNLDYGSQNIRRSIKDNIRVSCFSKSPDILLMWSHYTKSHGGFCLEFDVDKMGNEFHWIDVTYVDNPPSASIFDKNNTEWFLRHKYVDWKYEEEIRVFSAHERTYVNLEAITGLYLGSNTLKRTPEARNYLRRMKIYLDEFLPHLKTELKIAKLNKDKFKITFDNYSYGSLEVACKERLD